MFAVLTLERTDPNDCNSFVLSRMIMDVIDKLEAKEKKVSLFQTIPSVDTLLTAPFVLGS